jgi:hypothetical protein
MSAMRLWRWWGGFEWMVVEMGVDFGRKFGVSLRLDADIG